MVRGVRRVARYSMVGRPLQRQRIPCRRLRDARRDWLHRMRRPTRNFISGPVRVLDPRLVRSVPDPGAPGRMGHL